MKYEKINTYRDPSPGARPLPPTEITVRQERAVRRQSTTEEILIARGFRRTSTTEEMIRCRNFRRQSSQSDDVQRFVDYLNFLLKYPYFVFFPPIFYASDIKAVLTTIDTAEGGIHALKLQMELQAACSLKQQVHSLIAAHKLVSFLFQTLTHFSFFHNAIYESMNEA